MQSDNIKGQIRQRIVEKSVQILRKYGKSSEEIRSIILCDFHIEEKALDKILNADIK